MDTQALPSPVRPLVDEQRAAPKSSKYSPERLASIKQRLVIERAAMASGSPSDSDIGQEQLAVMALDYVPGLIEEVSYLQGRLKEEQEAKKTEVLDILRDMRLPLLPFPKNDATEAAIVLGRNMERQAANDYCRQKAYEYDRQGIGPDPTEPGQWDTLPKADPTLPCQGDCQTCGVLPEGKWQGSDGGEVVTMIDEPFFLPPGAHQFPGMPEAKCHGCGLPSHVARCQNQECPMKPAAGSGVGLQGEGVEGE